MTMTIEEIRKGKPDGATMYMELGRYTDGSGYLIAYYRILRHKLFVFDCNDWVESEYRVGNPIIKPL